MLLKIDEHKVEGYEWKLDHDIWFNNFDISTIWAIIYRHI
jgi:hypothetical protein